MLVPNSATASTSSATHTGSVFIDLAKASQLPYLLSRAWCHSSVAANLYSHFNVSTGFVIPLTVAVNVLIALAGILPKNWITLGFVSHFNISSAQIRLSHNVAFCHTSHS
jgi:hypothetical protein